MTLEIGTQHITATCSALALVVSVLTYLAARRSRSFNSRARHAYNDYRRMLREVQMMGHNAIDVHPRTDEEWAATRILEAEGRARIHGDTVHLSAHPRRADHVPIAAILG